MAGSRSKQDIETRAAEVCGPLLEAEGLELLELEWMHEHEGWVLRLYIDRPGAGVGIEDCALATQTVNTALDVADFIPHAYSLEVSSPGLNRPLRKPRHFANVVGKQVRVKTFAPLGPPPGRRNFLGTLIEAGEERVRLDVEGAGTFDIALKDIARANLEHEFP